jgi:UDP-2,4-diacetamido-2,4,6-trideoxy-beta-L-altropyranose hydrolase
MTLRIAFRTDASLRIGSGHVMRCLTLADALRSKGAQCHFISREHPGHLIEVIRQRGHIVKSLSAPAQQTQAVFKKGPTHTAWLGSAWETDAQETAAVLASLRPDWLIVDHYALDQQWEIDQLPHCKKLLVIDDLADRPHFCNLLLDQNLGRQPQDYVGLVPTHNKILTGPQYALLSPDFAALRLYSLQRRQAQTSIGRLLITMGGVDQDNTTGQVLHILKACVLPDDCRITVVMGLTAPWLQNVLELAIKMPWPTEVVVNVNDMARRMADSDLAIGAAGSTSWERCCLGLPTLLAVLAENQQLGAQAMEAAHAARLIGAMGDIATQLPLAVAELIEPACRSRMSLAASSVTDGRGIEMVLGAMGVIDV